MERLVEFLSSAESGTTEEEICSKFPRLSKENLARMLNELLESRVIDVGEEDGKLVYRAVRNRTEDYESMVIGLLEKAGSTGLWLRDIKSKTNIPHSLILKILKNLEIGRRVKSIKSVKTNRKMYMMYEVKPDEEVTGGVWFSNNDVDLIFVEKMMEIICRFCKRPEGPFALSRVKDLVRLRDLKSFIESSRVTGISLSIMELEMLVDALVYDGKVEKYTLEDGIAVRTLPK